ncbi:MAG: polyketide cyclase [Bacteroidetes bacterium]|nr:MAG: polyketide cyclase [Bacteroidota bacterium]
MPPAQHSATHFSHSLSTRATPEKIWQVWTDVPRWKDWDSGLKDARLDGPFQAGATGTLIPDKGPESRFVISEVSEGIFYTFKTKLPLGYLYVKRSLSTENGQTLFAHEVWFTGPFKGIFGRLLGKSYRELLPEVMNRIKILAEAKP